MTAQSELRTAEQEKSDDTQVTEEGDDLKEDILKQFQKAGAVVSDDRCRMEVSFPSDEGKTEGKLITVFPKNNILFHLIWIYSTVIPDIVAKPVREVRTLKINYCVRGRCELQLKSGECTYLTAGEIAIDGGQTKNSFYYPSEEYIGYEVIVHMDEESENEKWPASMRLYETVFRMERPWIQKADKYLAAFYEPFRYYTEENLGTELIFLKCMELMVYLTKLDLNQPQISRTYHTASQVGIAKKVKDLICSDLSVRLSAKTLADRFGIGETSIKNYFRSVYGCGFAEFQQTVRMERAATMLKETDAKIADIGLTVGFSSQPKFGVAFKKCYGVTPLEYRRLNKLERSC